MPTNQQRRQTAKRKLERQIERRAQRARRRRRTLTIGSVVAVVAVIAVAVGVYFIVSSPDTPEPATAAGACTYTPEGQASKPVTPPDADPPQSGTVALTLATSQGPIGLTLDRSTARCAVNAVTSLAQQGFYNDTPCHRLTTGEGLKVLQCGDPTGSGSGGPGFQYAEEPPTGLAPVPNDPSSSVYSRGLVAMAKTSQPNTTGSQFFLVYGDSQLPPQYTVVGRIDTAGLGVIDRVAAAGSDNSNQQGDGKPVTPVQIQTATVS